MRNFAYKFEEEEFAPGIILACLADRLVQATHGMLKCKVSTMSALRNFSVPLLNLCIRISEAKMPQEHDLA